MRVAIMQPYFLPYIGYFQLIANSDLLVVYDNIKYTKKGWINRNRFLLNGSDATFSLPLRKASDSLDIVERELAEEYDRERLLKQLAGAYRRAPYFASTFALLEQIVRYEENNLFRYLYHSLETVRLYLGISPDLVISSAVSADHHLRGQERVLSICEGLGADRYLNPPGGINLYDEQVFARRGVALEFLRPQLHPYPQFGAPFVPGLSIVDVLMFNSAEACSSMLSACEVFVPETAR